MEKKVEVEDEERNICKKIEIHVIGCHNCKRKLSFNPIEKSILKTYSVKNEIIELIAYIGLGVFIILILDILKR